MLLLAAISRGPVVNVECCVLFTGTPFFGCEVLSFRFLLLCADISAVYQVFILTATCSVVDFRVEWW